MVPRERALCPSRTLAPSVRHVTECTPHEPHRRWWRAERCAGATAQSGRVDAAAEHAPLHVDVWSHAVALLMYVHRPHTHVHVPRDWPCPGRIHVHVPRDWPCALGFWSALGPARSRASRIRHTHFFSRSRRHGDALLKHARDVDAALAPCRHSCSHNCDSPPPRSRHVRCTDRLRPLDQPSCSVAWDASWGWNHGRLGGSGALTPAQALRYQMLTTKMHAHFATHLTSAADADAESATLTRATTADSKLSGSTAVSKLSGSASAGTLVPPRRHVATPITRVPPPFVDLPPELLPVFQQAPGILGRHPPSSRASVNAPTPSKASRQADVQAAFSDRSDAKDARSDGRARSRSGSLKGR
jgi:hypothetical protein